MMNTHALQFVCSFNLLLCSSSDIFWSVFSLSEYLFPLLPGALPLPDVLQLKNWFFCRGIKTITNLSIASFAASRHSFPLAPQKCSLQWDLHFRVPSYLPECATKKTVNSVETSAMHLAWINDCQRYRMDYSCLHAQKEVNLGNKSLHSSGFKKTLLRSQAVC